MQWKNSFITPPTWNHEISNRAAKENVAEIIAVKARQGQVIGAGSGSTAYLALCAIAQRSRAENLNIRIIPTSHEIAMACISLGLCLSDLNSEQPDWAFDGADEIDPDGNMLKGRGGAMFKEKLLICASPLTYILADPSKMVARLGTHFAIPVEVFPPALAYACKQINVLGAIDIQIRAAKGKDGPVISENGNLILDIRFPKITQSLESALKNITGVIESGLFTGYHPEIIMADD